MDFLTNLSRRFIHFGADTPYSSEDEYIKDINTLISGYLYLACTIKRGDDESGYGVIDGTAFTIDNAMSYLENYNPKSVPVSDDIIELFTEVENCIDYRLSLTENAESYRFLRLRDTFSLNDFAYFCILCGYAAATNRAFETAFQLLHLTEKKGYPTLESATAIYSLIHPSPTADMQDFCSAGSVVSVIFEKQEDTDALMHPLRLKDHVVAFLSGRDYGTHGINCSLITGSDENELRFCDEQLQELCSALEINQTTNSAELIALCGAVGTGKKLTMHTAARKHNTAFLLVPFRELAECDYREIFLYAVLEKYHLCFEDIDTEDSDNLQKMERLIRGLLPFSPTIVLLSTDLRQNLQQNGYTYRRVEYPRLTQRQQLAHWEHYSQKYNIADDIDWQAITATYMLTPGQIVNSLQQALLDGIDGKISNERIRDAILQCNTGKLSELADRIHSYFGWDDLVLSEIPKGLLKNACNRIKYKFKVEDNWGFRKKSIYGNGISVLLYGPPGTGKTMSAQVIAGELGLPLYRINISQITSKYIGETAKNLNTIFEEAKKTNAILFFDEADALFSKRTDIQSSNDRHANSEVSYLLQKIEEFSGVSILATNLAGNFDEAFRRRINYIVNIHMPSPEQRLKLWKLNIPKQAPIDEDIDFDMLAENLEISGSVIKSTVIQAAYYAAEQDCPINMRHIVMAMRVEMQKLGKPVPLCFDIYGK